MGVKFGPLSVVIWSSYKPIRECVVLVCDSSLLLTQSRLYDKRGNIYSSRPSGSSTQIISWACNIPSQPYSRFDQKSTEKSSPTIVENLSSSCAGMRTELSVTSYHRFSLSRYEWHTQEETNFPPQALYVFIFIFRLLSSPKVALDANS